MASSLPAPPARSDDEIVSKGERRRQDKQRTLARAEERKRVALRVYQGCDEAGARKLDDLAARGVKPTCTAGCAHCCSLEIPVSRPEAEVLVAWLIANRSAPELDAIRERLRGWLAWYRTDYPALIASGVSRVDAFFRHAPSCALLENARCGGYPARPITCRNHYVSSPVAECDPAVGTGNPDILLEVARATSHHVAELRSVIENQGGSYLGSIHLISEWLAHLLDVESEPWRGAPALVLS